MVQEAWRYLVWDGSSDTHNFLCCGHDGLFCVFFACYKRQSALACARVFVVCRSVDRVFVLLWVYGDIVLLCNVLGRVFLLFHMFFFLMCWLQFFYVTAMTSVCLSGSSGTGDLVWFSLYACSALILAYTFFLLLYWLSLAFGFHSRPDVCGFLIGRLGSSEVSLR